jgi:hypothetical protein
VHPAEISDKVTEEDVTLEIVGEEIIDAEAEEQKEPAKPMVTTRSGHSIINPVIFFQ